MSLRKSWKRGKSTMSNFLSEQLTISKEAVEQINHVLADSSSSLLDSILQVIARYGSIEEINEKSRKARTLENLCNKLKLSASPYLKDIYWLREQRDRAAFVGIEEFRKGVLGELYPGTVFSNETAVTLEISACQFFPWIISQAKRAIEFREIMPGRFIRVRNMKESEADQGDLVAGMAAMDILGSSYVDTLDTRGTDGSNVHLGGADTITGYFGGVGQPNDYALKWLDEYLYYYTNYGVTQVLNVNAGTILIAYLIHRLGINNEFKISVFMGNDNPYAVWWTLLGARLFAREDGSTPLVGFNLSNSVNNETIRLSADIRRTLGFEDRVRIEHHITETYKSIVCQPYNRRDELLELAGKVKNISAKHEGGDLEDEQLREHASDLLDYFLPKSSIEESNLMGLLEQNYLDKHKALNRTAVALTKKGHAFIGAKNLHL